MLDASPPRQARVESVQNFQRRIQEAALRTLKRMIGRNNARAMVVRREVYRIEMILLCTSVSAKGHFGNKHSTCGHQALMQYPADSF